MSIPPHAGGIGDAGATMPFRSGSISYALFRVSSTRSGGGGEGSGGAAPAAADASLLDRLAEHTLKESGIGEPQPMEFGWCGGRHVLDEAFDPEHVVFDDGLLFGLRVDVNRIPGEIRRAYLAQAQQAMATDGQPYLSKREKAAAREEAEARCREDLAAGKYRRSKMVEVLWDVARGVVLAPAFGDGVVGGLRDLFFETFDLRLSPLSSGALAFDVLSKRGRGRDYEELKPSVFTPPPAGVNEGDGAEGGVAGERGGDGRPPVPWAHVSPEPSDFVGNEFLLWLLWQVVERGGEIRTEAGDVAVVIERVLDMECPWGVTGKQGLQSAGPGQSPEARRGLLNGKWPRKAGLLVSLDGEQWSCTLQADRLLVTGLKAPAPEEAPGSPRELIEHRLASLRRFNEALGGLFARFLDDRAGSAWATPRQKISAWIRGERAGRAEADAGVAVIETKPGAGAGLRARV